MAPSDAILVLNAGSSSVKFAVFERGDGDSPQRRLDGNLERLGTPEALLRINNGNQHAKQEQLMGGPDASSAVRALLQWLSEHFGPVAGVVHRVVHGGHTYFDPSPVDARMIAELHRLASLDPAHLPAEIQLMDIVASHYPGLPQFACFDTAFHRDLPTVSRVLAIPRRWTKAGIRRFGFHGLSYQYLLRTLGEVAGESAGRGRIILAHLGSGASLAAVRDGVSIDTTMSFTPTAGLVMATRCGDLDPGVLIYLLRHARNYPQAHPGAGAMTVDQIDDMLNRQSGLKGISDISADMRDLLAARATDPHAAQAVDIFCYQVKKFIGAMAAALGGLDTLVFSAGIGEHLPAVRAQICEELNFLGIQLDSEANKTNSPVISRSSGPVTVRVIPTDEQITLARAGFALLD